MPMAVVLSGNIYDEDAEKRLRGEAFDASQEFIDAVLQADQEAGRQPRITAVEPPKRKAGRPRKEDGDEAV